jgi:hypothetical protein
MSRRRGHWPPLSRERSKSSAFESLPVYAGDVEQLRCCALRQPCAMQNPHELQQRIILQRIAQTVGRLNQELETLEETLEPVRRLEPEFSQVWEVLQRWTSTVEAERERTKQCCSSQL